MAHSASVTNGYICSFCVTMTTKEQLQGEFQTVMVGMALPKSWQWEPVTKSPHIVADRKEAGETETDRQRDNEAVGLGARYLQRPALSDLLLTAMLYPLSFYSLYK